LKNNGKVIPKFSIPFVYNIYEMINAKIEILNIVSKPIK